jgi:hypothetical protein
VLQKGRDVGRCGENGEDGVGTIGMRRKWFEVLGRRVMWRGRSNMELRKWCVRTWDEIRMVHRSMRNCPKVADELYIKRVLLALEDFLFFSLYWFSCIAKQITTLR